MKNLNHNTVCIFCSSSHEVPEIIKQEGAKFARLLAENDYSLLYGGTTCGLMKIVADAHKEANGRLIGVIPGYMVEKGINHPELDKIIEVEDLSPRKQAMLENSDHIVALPGGIGTFDEFFDLLTMKQLKRHNKPMYLLNTDGYYEPLMNLLKHGIEKKTINADNLQLFQIANTPEELLQMIKGH
jgi:uncharacterized protein (TIGR00730 family)